MERIAETNRRLALTDPLTSLPNRRHLERYLDQALAHAVFAAFHQAGARLRPFSLVLFDVDDFKRLNERHGYVAGDRVLATVGAVLSRVCPNACPALTARLGGDEFVAILPGKATDQARKAARRMAEAVARDPALSSQGVTVSFGVAAPDATMRHHRELLAAADRDLHRRRAARSRPARRSPGHSPRAGAPHILVRRSRADCANPRSSRDRAHHVTPGTSAMTPSRRDTHDLQEFERSAEEFARAAGQVALGYFRTRIKVDTKADGTPVTIADREAESLLRAEIRRRYPDHGIVGEEHGEVLPGAPVRWILDPIDGTKSFVHGVPLWGVLIGIEVDGEPVVGVVHLPALGEMVTAAKGRGCRWNGAPCSVSTENRLDRSLVLTTNETAMHGHPDEAGWRALAAAAHLTRGWGDCYGHVLVATGRAQVMVDPGLASWDAAPLLTIVTEAGGCFTDLSGESTIHGGSGVSSNPALHPRVLKLLAADP